MQKNRDGTEESGRTSVDTESLSFGAALLLGFADSQANKKYPAFRQGAAEYRCYYWHDFADQASQKLLDSVTRCFEYVVRERVDSLWRSVPDWSLDS
jgi:hypothetical protein